VLEHVARQVAERYPGLYAHQQTGITFLLARRRAILADDMGLGKTRQAIIALREAVPAGPYLVICPAAVKLTWQREIRLVERDAAIHVIRTGRDWNPETAARWYIINYELLGALEDVLLAQRWAGVVVDEAHYIKNDSKRTTRVLRLLGVQPGRKQPVQEPEVVYLLTGTPMSNRPRELFNLLKAVRHPLAKNFYAYAVRYCAAFDNGYGLDTRGASNLGELAQLISGVMLRRTKDDALDLPPRMRSWQPVEISPRAWEEVWRLELHAVDYFRQNPATQGPTWKTFLGLLNRARHALAKAKTAATIEAVRERLEADEKVVVFSTYLEVIRQVAQTFEGAVVTITGADSAAERQRAADALQRDPAIRVLAGNLHAAGVGLTLTAATHVIFNDLDWVPGNHWQAEDRIYRIGQTRPAFITYLYTPGTLDEFVAALLERKAQDIAILETTVAQNASLVREVVEATLRGERLQPAGVRTESAEPATGRTVGLLEEMLDLLARAQRGLAAAAAAEQVFEVPSSSKPGEYYTVTVLNGVATCTCPGFTYRGNCRHTREIVARLTRAG
jgi:SWI/SNF-related matrix-associated actin-dependent regulator 1 of chromatin subfamily A